MLYVGATRSGGRLWAPGSPWAESPETEVKIPGIQTLNKKNLNFGPKPSGPGSKPYKS